MKTREEIIKKAQELLACGALSKDACDAIKADFPELAESEDERVRKEIVDFLRFTLIERGIKNGNEKADKWIAYLEKHKEPHIPWYDYQKSKEAGYTIVPNEEYEQLIKQKEQKELPLMDGNADLYFDEWNQQKQNPTKRQCFEEGMRYAERLQKEQKPAEWSEEDERIRQRLIKDLENAETDDEDVQKELNEDVAWLKSLRPQPHWKPSEEQMEALDEAQAKLNSTEWNQPLCSLIDDLKKTDVV